MSGAPVERVEAVRPPRTAAEERRLRWIVRLGSPLLKLLSMTWRVREVGATPWQRMHGEKRPVIISLWHGQLLTMCWVLRPWRMSVMVSEHADGEIIARIIELWGYRTVRGSTSRGAGRALLGMIREVEAGRSFIITPDGPRGPAGLVQGGVLLASQRSGAPAVPVLVESDRAWYLNGWDRFMIPKPFARVRVTYGTPWVATGTDEAAQRELAERMGPAIPAHLPPRK
ncbi:MAG: lysophospholipid acyltransferase family protein [Gemmatimonadetes bacterium]|nr:lysophospholipid acyltransferase family protein [Gemmatimonadota bacterium]